MKGRTRRPAYAPNSKIAFGKTQDRFYYDDRFDIIANCRPVNRLKGTVINTQCVYTWVFLGIFLFFSEILLFKNVVMINILVFFN